jgi:glycosyltransferase involved in cell wall biosynthesis
MSRPTTAPDPPSGDPTASPWFSVTMTVRNNAATIERCLASILGQLGTEGEVFVVDPRSTDGTWEQLERLAASDARLSVRSEACNRGVGRNLAVRASRGAVVLTQFDGDNVYAPGVIERTARETRDHAGTDVTFAVGLEDWDPSTTRFYAWRREAFWRAGGYPDRQEQDDPPLLLGAFRHGLSMRRLALERVATDLKPRAPRFAASVGPWGRFRHSLWAARRFRVLGFRWAEFLGFLRLTRRSTVRYLVGATVGTLGYLLGALRKDGVEILHPAFVGMRPPDRGGST